MEHHFDVDIAKEFGILEAILLNNIFFWIKHNEANEVNFYDGDYWTFNSTRAFTELIPYASQRQIQNALKHLISEGILKTGNYNKIAYDRTLWYAFTEKGKCIMQKCKMDYAEMSNRNDEKGKPIPDNKPDVETQFKNTNKERKKETTYDEIINSYDLTAETKELIYEFIKMRKMKKKPLTDRALKIQINKLLKISVEPNIQKQVIEKAITKCWDEFYPPTGQTIQNPTGNQFKDFLEKEYGGMQNG